ncbi:MAG: phage tail sheath family protein [Bacteroidetes bacterium]|nr:phage tail sheath family protein [Bacteroidota bacterium]
MLNLTSLKTPGVYIDEVPKFPPSVAAVETAIPAFIGYTEKAEKDKIDLHAAGPALVRITSFAEFVEYFGDAPFQAVSVGVQLVGGAYEPVSASVASPSNYRMYHALRLFYANGGGPCYIVSVGKYKLDGSVSANEMGTNGTASGGVDVIRKVDEVTLFVFPDANGFANDADYYSLFDKGLQQSGDLMDRFTLIDVRNGKIDPVIANFRNATLNTAALKYGASYYPWLKTTYNYRTSDTSITLALPDGADPDADPDSMTLAAAKLDATHAPLLTNAFLSKLDRTLARERVVMPPSPAIAGIYAAVDGTRGVWKAPANVGVADIIEPLVKITDGDQRDLNISDTGKSVNAIRTFTGKGTLVWGSRTLAGNDNEWRYVPVRRFFNMVEESTKKSSEQFVFEPNDANTWVRVQAMIENFLTTLWRVGALQGAKPEHAFYVAVGLGKTMTPLDILEGRMIVEIGMAAVRPAEFIILRFSHKMAES